MNKQEIMQVFMFLQKHKAEFSEWNEITFRSFICMALEEWCKKNDRDVVEVSAEIAEIVERVNEQEGKYE